MAHALGQLRVVPKLWLSVDPRFEVEPLVGCAVRAELRGDSQLTEELRDVALRMATPGSSSFLADDLLFRAWGLMQGDEADISLALRFARAGVELGQGYARSRMTLARALIANGLHDEAIAESKRSIELAGQEKETYVSWHRVLLDEIDKVGSRAADPVE